MINKRRFNSILLIIVILFNLLSNYSVIFAYTDGDAAYEENKNYRFSLDDVNSSTIKKIYNPDNTQVPSRFSLKDELKQKYNITIPVADQGNLGLCDTFATVKCAETNYALKNGRYIDISERYLNYMTSKYYYSNHGEPGTIPTAQNNYTDIEGSASSGSEIMTFLETFGAPTEQEIPYTNYSTEQDSRLLNAKPALMVTSSVTLPMLQDLTDTTLKEKWIKILKIHLMKYGSINVPIDVPRTGTTYNPTTNSHYYKKGVTASGGGHGVSIVGWDDNYSKSNFLVEPEHDGAFIVLNSWGDDWGDDGYFYISYDDDNITVQMTGVLETKVPETYNQYTYAEKLYSSNGYGDGYYEHKYIGIKFNTNGDNEYLSHITAGMHSFYESDYTSKVKVYLNPEDDSFDKSKLILLEETNRITRSEHTNITLKNPIKIKGNKFSLVFETIGDIDFVASKDTEDNYITGNLYLSGSLNGSWSKTTKTDIPIYVFTISKNITGLSIKKAPNKTSYVKGTNLNLTGGIINVTYDDGSTEDIQMTDSNVTVTGYNKNSLGSQEITVSYGGKTAKFNVTVKNDMTGISVKKVPNKTSYIKGEGLELTGGIISVLYEDNSSNDISMTSNGVTVTGYNANTLGTQQLTVSYGGKTAKFNVTVENKINGVNVKIAPNKTSYVKGENLNLTGGIIAVTYEDGSSSDVAMTSNGVTVTGYNANTLGNQEITVNYSGKTAKFNVTVKNDMTGISIKTAPTKTTYIKGEDLDLTGGKISALYEDNSSSEISMTPNEVTVTGYDKDTLGTQQLTVSYGGKTAKFNVNVKNDITGISIKTAPIKSTYTKGENLDLTGGKISVTYEDNSSSEVSLLSEGVSVTGYDANTLGNQEITVSYEGKTTKFNISVENKITGIHIKRDPNKVSYIKGENLDLVGGTILVIYEDGSTSEVPMTSNDISISGYKSNILGKQEITVSYGGKTAEFNVNVKNDITSIKVKKVPSKITYIKGENIELSGGILEVIYEDGSSAQVPIESNEISVSEYNTNTLGIKEITVSYGGKTTKFNVTVKNDIIGINIKKLPNKITYASEDNIDLTGGTIEVMYEDGSTSEVPMTSKEIGVSYIIDEETGNKTISITYNGKVAEFNINISNKKDDTVSNTIIPQTGEISKYTIPFIIIIGLGIISFIKYKNYKKYMK